MRHLMIQSCAPVGNSERPRRRNDSPPSDNGFWPDDRKGGAQSVMTACIMTRNFTFITSLRSRRAGRTLFQTSRWCTSTVTNSSTGAGSEGVTGLLEPCAVKIARTVLRGGGDSDAASLPDRNPVSSTTRTVSGSPRCSTTQAQRASRSGAACHTARPSRFRKPEGMASPWSSASCQAFFHCGVLNRASTQAMARCHDGRRVKAGRSRWATSWRESFQPLTVVRSAPVSGVSPGCVALVAILYPPC